MSLNQLLTNPVPIAPLPANTSEGFIGLASGATGLSQCFGPIKYNKSLYMVGLNITTDNHIFVSQSGIGGMAWQVLDESNGPLISNSELSPQGSAFYGGGNVITVAYSPTANVSTATLGPVQFQDFNLDTLTWGAPYGTAGAPSVYQVGPMFKRPAGDYIVLVGDNITGGSLVGLQATVWSPTVGWTAPFSIDTGLSGGFVSVADAAALIDSAGRLHVFSIATTTAPAQELYYQMVNPDNSLGTFRIVEQNLAGNIGGSGISRQPATDGTNLVIGGVNSKGQPIAYIGTPLSAPVFGSGVVIDPGGASAPPSDQVQNPVFAFGTQGWYAAYAYQVGADLGAANIRVGQALAPGGTWTWIQAFQGGAASNFFGPGHLGVSLIGTTNNEALQVVSDAQTSEGVGVQPLFFYLGVAVVPIEIFLTGIKRYSQVTKASPIIQVTQPTAVSPPVATVLAPPAPIAQTTQAPCPPIYSNLCWALRNGMVQASQFDPQELQALQYRCSQLGYTGNCPPPPCIQEWIIANISNLPHISVTQDVLNALPQAPQIGNCTDSYTKGGVPQNILQIGGIGNYGRRR